MDEPRKFPAPGGVLCRVCRTYMVYGDWGDEKVVVCMTPSCSERGMLYAEPTIDLFRFPKERK